MAHKLWDIITGISRISFEYHYRGQVQFDAFMKSHLLYIKVQDSQCSLGIRCKKQKS